MAKKKTTKKTDKEISKNTIEHHKKQSDLIDKFFNEPSFAKKSLIFLKASKDDKQTIKKIANDKKEALNKNLESFDKKENVFEVRNFSLWYHNKKKQALFNIDTDIKRNQVTALIGPSGCGKSTFIRCLNRMNDLIPGLVTEGHIYYDDGTNIKSKKLSSLELTTRVGMVFQKPAPFPMSIYENVAYGPKSHGVSNHKKLDEIVKNSLKGAALWDEVKDHLNDLGTSLSGGQQQRLCIARAIAMEPEVLLMDEPTSGLDPIATGKVEKLVKELKKKYTIIIVTHSMAQAQRISDRTVFFFKGKIIEEGTTKKIFTAPEKQKTKEYISGKIG